MQLFLNTLFMVGEGVGSVPAFFNMFRMKNVLV
jgi:hypothetical protein